MEDDEFKKLFGAKVQVLRKRKGLTQEMLAERIDRSIDTVCNIERGFSLTSMDTVLRLSKTLEAPLSELFELSAPMVKDKKKRHILKRLDQLIADQDVETLKAIADQAEILVRRVQSSITKV